MKQLSLLIIWLLPVFAFATTYTVTLTTDTHSGGIPAPVSGELRWAINQANSNPGTDIIAFNIAGIAPHTIQLQSEISITSTLTMDGNTQPANGYVGIQPKITIKGSMQMTLIKLQSITQCVIKNITFRYGKKLLELTGDNTSTNYSTIQNCVFFDANECLHLISSSYNRIMGNHFGTDRTLSVILSVGYDNSIVLGANLVGDGSMRNVIGGFASGQPNYFYNMQNANKPLCTDSPSLFNKIGGNIFKNNAKNIHHIDGLCLGQCVNPPHFTVTASGSNYLLAGGANNFATSSSGIKVYVYLSNATGIDAIQFLDSTTTSDFYGHWSMTLSGLPANFKLIATSNTWEGATTEFSPPYPKDTIPCDGCITSFSPKPGSYIVSAWVKEDNYGPTVFSFTHSKIQLTFPGASGPAIDLLPAGKIIDGWQRIEKEIVVPVAATDIVVKLMCTSGIAYFDDVRFFPVDGSMKSYVYDPQSLRLMAELDERNYATLYEYDEEGKLVRVKKETERGVMTIKENRNNLRKRQ